MEKGADVFDLSKRLPSQEEIQGAVDAAKAIARACRRNSGQLPFSDENGDNLLLSPALCELITDVLSHVSRGEMVTVVGTSANLSTQEAADILNVSRPFLIKLINEGQIECFLVGTHRRIRLSDLMSFKENRDKSQRMALIELAAIGQEMDVK